VIATWVKPEGLAAKRSVDGFFHSSNSPSLKDNELTCWFCERDARNSRRYWRLHLRFRGQLRIIERVYSLDFSVYDVNLIKDVIHAIYRLHVEKSCDVISFDDVLLQLDALDHRQDAS
jgi:hypothetical protein